MNRLLIAGIASFVFVLGVAFFACDSPEEPTEPEVTVEAPVAD